MSKTHQAVQPNQKVVRLWGTNINDRKRFCLNGMGESFDILTKILRLGRTFRDRNGWKMYQICPLWENAEKGFNRQIAIHLIFHKHEMYNHGGPQKLPLRSWNLQRVKSIDGLWALDCEWLDRKYQLLWGRTKGKELTVNLIIFNLGDQRSDAFISREGSQEMETFIA